MLIIEEKNLNEESSTSAKAGSGEQVLYSNTRRGRGRGRGRGQGGGRAGFQQQQNYDINQSAGGRGQSRGRGSARGRGRNSSSQQDCWYCGKPGHMQAQCYKRQNDIRNGKLQQGNYASSSKNEDDKERLFVMQHVVNAVSENGVKDDCVWYVDSGASNHMTSHGEWFKEIQSPEKPGFVETGDNTSHPIAHVGRVPLCMDDGNVRYLADVLHVPKITKNLVSVGQMVEQGLQVRFNLDGCFVEDLKNKCRLVAKGKRQGRMFMLDVEIPEVKAAMFANGSRVVVDTDIWHKKIGHVNMQRLKLMQSKEIVTGLPKFKVEGMQKICEACQFGKQT